MSIGAGKTAALKIMAKTNNYSLQEWINPVDCEVINALGDQDQGSSYLGSQVDLFKNFLLRASRYKSLLDGGNDRRLLLVEDFPNFLLNDAPAFENILE